MANIKSNKAAAFDPEIFYSLHGRGISQAIEKAVNMTSAEASKLPSPLNGKKHPMAAFDTPITIHCGGEEEHWQSRFLCFWYYTTGASACDPYSSEGERYGDIASYVFSGRADFGALVKEIRESQNTILLPECTTASA